MNFSYLWNLLGRRVAAFGYMAGFAGAAVAIDVWCHQKSGAAEKYGALTPYPNEDALISYTKKRLSTAGNFYIFTLHIALYNVLTFFLYSCS